MVEFKKIKIGVSHCLLGEKVRYDGGHKLSRFIRDHLGKFVEFVPVCPEVECGLSIPRESMHLEGTPENLRLVTSRTKKDLTGQMTDWIDKRLVQLKDENLCGFIFKSKSPSSGMRGITIVGDNGKSIYHGPGIFAKAFMQAFPQIPVEDEGRLNDAKLRENFIERIFIFNRWQELLDHPSRKKLIDFHATHKLILMSHSPANLRKLGKIVAGSENFTFEEQLENYFSLLIESIRLISTVKKNTNVLQHAMGYFKKLISADEKQELNDIIMQYHDYLIPLIVPVTLFNHYIRKYQVEYLQRQFYFNPHPYELMLRNHV